MDASSNAQTRLAVIHLCNVNNQSVEWIALGDFQSAFHHLQDGVRLVSGMLRTASNPQRGEEGVTMSPCNHQHIETFPRYSEVIEREGQVIGLPGHSPKSNILSLPFLITRIPDVVNKSSGHHHHHCTVQSVASVSIYNMGIACFSKSYYSVTCRTRERLLDRAFFLFRQAVQLADASTEIYLATCHNLIELCVDRGDLKEAQHWRRCLLNATDAMGNSWGAYQQAARIYHAATFAASSAA